MHFDWGKTIWVCIYWWQDTIVFSKSVILYILQLNNFCRFHKQQRCAIQYDHSRKCTSQWKCAIWAGCQKRFLFKLFNITSVMRSNCFCFQATSASWTYLTVCLIKHLLCRAYASFFLSLYSLNLQHLVI